MSNASIGLMDGDWREHIPALQKLLLWHGVLGERSGHLFDGPTSEEFRYHAVRSLFLLIPRSALSSLDGHRPFYVKPLIREHLQSLGVSADELLVEILKRVSEQLRLTNSPGSGYLARKVTIAALRARNPRKYLLLRERQGQRCGVCGISLGETQEELDHIIPFQIIGDVPDGSNWQILCGTCNSSKNAFFSAYQHPEALNWVYGRVLEVLEKPTSTTLYTVRAIRKCCSVCGRGPEQTHLHVFSRASLGLWVADHLEVVCIACLESAVKYDGTFQRP